MAGMNGFSAFGTRIPSSSWKFSKIAHSTRVVAHIVALSMCTKGTCKTI
uniref:Uncharacterized protein n=1 Tax=Parascaris univalens TaxID=6257 RepID=A0A915CCZ2_PARUN